MSVATPVKAWVATASAGAFSSIAQTFTVLINITQSWEIQIPVGVRYGTSVSLATSVYILPSNDGGVGANYDTEPLVSYGIPAVASAKKMSSVRLTTGMYSIAMVSSSPSTTFFILTQEVVTSYNIV